MTIDPLTLKVYKRAAWSDAWTEVSDLDPIQWTRCISPGIPSAQLQYRYGNIAQPGDSSYTAESKLGLIDNFVKITATWTTLGDVATATSAGKLVDSGQDFSDVAPGTPVYNGDDSTVTAVESVEDPHTLVLEEDIFTIGETYVVGGEWTEFIGYVPEDQDHIMGGSTGRNVISAVGLAYLFDRVDIEGSKHEGASGAAVTSGTTDGTDAGKLIDTGADFINNGVLGGHEAYNKTDDTTTTATAVTSGSQVVVAADIFVSGEDYIIRPKLADEDTIFNVRHNTGSAERGNRSDNVNADGVYEFSDDGAVWTWQQIAEYLVEYFAPRGIPVSITATDSLLNAIKNSFNPYGGSTLAALNQLVNTKLGLAWHVVTYGKDFAANETVEIEIVPRWGTNIVEGDLTVTANSHIVDIPINDAGTPADLVDVSGVVRHNTANKYDAIRVQGARIKSCFTASYQDGTIEKGWTDAQETAYETPGGADADANDQYRKDPKFERVYTWYRLPKAVALTAVGDGAGGATANASPGVAADGTIDFAKAGAIWAGYPPLCRELPLKVGVDYTTSPVTDNSPASPEPERQRPFAVVKSGGRYYLAHSTEELSEAGGANLRLAGREGAVIVKFPMPHLLADNHFAGAHATNTDPEFDWEELAVTVCAELPTRPYRLHVLNDAVFGSTRPRTKIITIDDCEVHTIAGNTVVGLTKAGALDYYGPAASATIRDDTDMLKPVMAAARAWYSADRNSLRYTRKRITGALRPGLYVQHAENGGTDIDIGTIVESHTVTIDHQAGTAKTTAVTGLGRIDFTGFAHLAGKREIQQDTATIKTRVRQLEQNDAHRPLRIRTSGKHAAAVEPAMATPNDVAAAAAVGTSVKYMREDAVIRGLHSIAKGGSAEIRGDATLSEGSNITLTQAGNNIAIGGDGQTPTAGTYIDVNGREVSVDLTEVTNYDGTAEMQLLGHKKGTIQWLGDQDAPSISADGGYAWDAGNNDYAGARADMNDGADGVHAESSWTFDATGSRTRCARHWVEVDLTGYDRVFIRYQYYIENHYWDGDTHKFRLAYTTAAPDDGRDFRSGPGGWALIGDAITIDTSQAHGFTDDTISVDVSSILPQGTVYIGPITESDWNGGATAYPNAAIGNGAVEMAMKIVSVAGIKY